MGIPEGCELLAGGWAQRYHRSAEVYWGTRPRQGSQRRFQYRRAATPTGLEHRDDIADRWCRCAQPPANSCDPCRGRA